MTQHGQLDRDDSGFPVGYAYKYLTASGTAAVKVSPGFLHSITVNKPNAALTTVALLDNASGLLTGTIGVVTFGTAGVPVSLFYDITYNSGLLVNLSAASDITIAYT